MLISVWISFCAHTINIYPMKINLLTLNLVGLLFKSDNYSIEKVLRLFTLLSYYHNFLWVSILGILLSQLTAKN